MKLLRDILYKAGLEEVIGSTNIAVTSVCIDSRLVEKHSLFVALKGTTTDGHKFIPEVIARGAIAIVCEDLPEERNDKVTYVKVRDAAGALGIMASNFYEDPSLKLKLIGITGTNGKTTTATLLYQLFRALGFRCGLISTVKNLVGNTEIPSTHTTPDPVTLNKLLARMVGEGCQYCFMEVSSHAVVQKRIAGLTFAGGVFTNITHDHLDYHVTFDAYIKAKKGFFDALPSDAFALVNKDDPNSSLMVQNTKAAKRSYSLKSVADFKCRIVENQFSGLLLNIDGTEVYTRLIGSFNAYNILSAYAVAMLMRQDKMNVLTTLSTLEPVEGRFQYVKNNLGITAIVDYAHTPDALQNVLKTIKDIRSGNEKVITVIGCGGDRDAGKRPVMAKIATELSDKVILTSDNPRSEDPQEILNQMIAGVEAQNYRKTLTIADRKEAIRTAVSLAENGDIILVAGKGHEKYQEIKGVKFPFDDLEILKENLNRQEL